MAAILRKNGACEVAGLASEGFPGSWWAATVLEVDRPKRTATVKYRDVSALKCTGAPLPNACGLVALLSSLISQQVSGSCTTENVAHFQCRKCRTLPLHLRHIG